MQTAKLAGKLARLIPVSLAVLAGGRGLGHRLVTLALLGAIAAIAPETLRGPALAAVLSSWEFDPAANQLELTVEQGAKPTYSVLNQPPRIVVELPKTQLAVRRSQKSYSGALRQIQVEDSGTGQVRIVLEFSPEVILNPAQVRLLKVAAPVSTGAFQERWVLNFSISDTGSLPAPAPAPVLVPVAETPRVPPAFDGLPAANLPPLRPVSGSSPALLPVERSPLPALPPERSALPSLPPAPAVSVPPLQRPSPLPPAAGSASASLFLPARTLLNLRYPGEWVLQLQPGEQLQEVLLIEDEIRDSFGNILLPAGTQVIGRFETNLGGSRFIAQGISLFGRNVRLEAESERLSQLSALQPGQIVRVRLKEALRP
ncbi:AMIN domain-containing protein [Kamptonema formosum]|uniref:AMIN domain-containing protein n=1 Tax=Kamptonema formosum TaxID=331992 RepID=UPI0003490E5A|nr:AMIN domain-containing protein [Oscillatoria sp. PCC 10802]